MAGDSWAEEVGELHQPDSVEKQRAFFDRFLKGIDNDVARWPKVRLEVRERYYVGKSRNENEWPPTRTKYQKLYLDARSGSLKTARSRPRRKRADAPGTATLPGVPRGTGAIRLCIRAATELTGHMKLRLWVEAVGADDMDLFIAIQKFDRHGKYVPFAAFSALEDGPVALGWLRASHRELDMARSTPEQPVIRTAARIA